MDHREALQRGAQARPGPWRPLGSGTRWALLNILTRLRCAQFKAFRKKLISSGAGPLKNVQFPRKTLSRHSSSHKTDSKRVPILQGWLNLVISVYSGQPSLAPEISEFLDTEQQNANTARLTISRHMAPFGPDPHLIAGDWVASGVNAFKNGEIETERFTIEVQEDGSLSGRATDPDAAGSGQDYTLDNVAIKPHPQDDSLVILEFHQVRVCTPARMFLERRN